MKLCVPIFNCLYNRASILLLMPPLTGTMALWSPVAAAASPIRRTVIGVFSTSIIMIFFIMIYVYVTPPSTPTNLLVLTESYFAWENVVLWRVFIYTWGGWEWVREGTFVPLSYPLLQLCFFVRTTAWGKLRVIHVRLKIN